MDRKKPGQAIQDLSSGQENPISREVPAAAKAEAEAEEKTTEQRLQARALLDSATIERPGTGESAVSANSVTTSPLLTSDTAVKSYQTLAKVGKVVQLVLGSGALPSSSKVHDPEAQIAVNSAQAIPVNRSNKCCVSYSSCVASACMIVVFAALLPSVLVTLMSADILPIGAAEAFATIFNATVSCEKTNMTLASGCLYAQPLLHVPNRFSLVFMSLLMTPYFFVRLKYATYFMYLIKNCFSKKSQVFQASQKVLDGGFADDQVSIAHKKCLNTLGKVLIVPSYLVYIIAQALAYTAAIKKLSPKISQEAVAVVFIGSLVFATLALITSFTITCTYFSEGEADQEQASVELAREDADNRREDEKGRAEATVKDGDIVVKKFQFNACHFLSQYKQHWYLHLFLQPTLLWMTTTYFGLALWGPCVVVFPEIPRNILFGIVMGNSLIAFLEGQAAFIMPAIEFYTRYKSYYKAMINIFKEIFGCQSLVGENLAFVAIEPPSCGLVCGAIILCVLNVISKQLETSAVLGLFSDDAANFTPDLLSLLVLKLGWPKEVGSILYAFLLLGNSIRLFPAQMYSIFKNLPAVSAACRKSGSNVRRVKASTGAEEVTSTPVQFLPASGSTIEMRSVGKPSRDSGASAATDGSDFSPSTDGLDVSPPTDGPSASVVIDNSESLPVNRELQFSP